MTVKIETKVFLNKSFKRLKIVEGFSQRTLKIDEECNGLFADVKKITCIVLLRFKVSLLQQSQP